MNVSVTLSANAGVSLLIGGRRIWIDALHDRPTRPFSTLTPSMLAQLQLHPAFQSPDLILFTHCHPDHFSHELAAAAAETWPEAQLILPEPILPRQTLLTGDETVLDFGNLRLHFFRLPHEQPERYDSPHYGLLLTAGDCTVLVPGDSAVAAPELAAFLQDRRIDLALLNFPWITLPRGRQFIRNVLRPAHLLAFHLPFAGDDAFGYRRAARKAVEQLRDCCDVRLLDAFLQTVTL
ncbi:MAG: MBL fold metallo-hydrolase [Ruminococcaceae bacterium]|nr:MBL fold metallo-hydrolase [Oscillospiraceae bacterium]